jgi:hypothetical protein
MMTTLRASREINRKDRTSPALLARCRYCFGYNEGENERQFKQIAEVNNNRADKLLERHNAVNERSAVAEYGLYCSGSIIIRDDGQTFIIDAQRIRNRHRTEEQRGS